MEHEGDARTLESRLAQIEEWKRRKDDAEYRAKIKAEEEYWEAVDALKTYNKRIEDICALADKLEKYKIGINDEVRAYLTPCGLMYKEIPGYPKRESHYMFGREVRSSGGFSVDHEIIYHNGEFKRCSTCSELRIYNEKPSTYYLRELYNEFPKFEKKFYEWFDRKLKN